MKTLEVAALAIRIFGILILFKLLGSLFEWLVTVSDPLLSPEEAPSKLSILMIYIPAAIISAILISFPTTISKIITPNPKTPSPELEIDNPAIQQAGIIVLGIYFIAQAIPDLVYNAIYIIIYSKSDQGANLNAIIIDEAITIIELMVGAYLTLGTQRIYSLIKRLRSAGLS